MDSALAFPQAWLWQLETLLAWETERFFFVLLLFLALGLETEWAWISWQAVSDVFVRESALVLL